MEGVFGGLEGTGVSLQQGGPSVPLSKEPNTCQQVSLFSIHCSLIIELDDE